MPRKRNGSRGSGKPVIRVFCEGESEQAYTAFLKERFSDVAVIKCSSQTGLFDEAIKRLTHDPVYRNYIDQTDEIWFFFDVEQQDIAHWDHRLEIIRKIRNLRKNPHIKVRLLMTTGCIEYWLMLHFKFYTPSLRTVADKEHVIKDLIEREPTYKKGDYPATFRIAANYPVALDNARATMKKLLSEGLPGLDDTDERNQWLCQNCFTFSNVHEAIEALQLLCIK